MTNATTDTDAIADALKAARLDELHRRQEADIADAAERAGASYPRHIREAAALLSMHPREILSVDPGPDGNLAITTFDGTRMIVATKPDANGRTGVMWAEPGRGRRAEMVYAPHHLATVALPLAGRRRAHALTRAAEAQPVAPPPPLRPTARDVANHGQEAVAAYHVQLQRQADDAAAAARQAQAAVYPADVVAAAAALGAHPREIVSVDESDDGVIVTMIDGSHLRLADDNQPTQIEDQR